MKWNLRTRMAPAAVVALAGLLMLSGCTKKSVATVNGLDITDEEFGARCASVVPDPSRQAGQSVALQVLEDLIRLKAVEKEVQSRKLMPSDEDVNKRLEAVKKQTAFFGQPLGERLKMEGRSEEDFKRDLRDSMIIDAYFLHDINVSDQEAQQYYDQNKENPQWSQKERVRLSEITVTSRDKLKKVTDELKSNASFPVVARSYSESASRTTDGQLREWFTKDQITSGSQMSLPPQVISKAFQMQPGDFSDPIQIASDPKDKSRGAWLIVRLEEKKPAESIPFAEIKEVVRHLMRMERAQQKGPEKMREFSKLMQDAQIEIKKPEYQEFLKRYRQAIAASAQQIPAGTGMPAPGAPAPGAPAPGAPAPGGPGAAAPKGEQPGHEGHGH